MSAQELSAAQLARVERFGIGRSEGVRLIGAERIRQQDVEGYDADHDEGHAAQLAAASTCYAAFAQVTITEKFTPEEAVRRGTEFFPPMWPWSSAFWKPTGDPMRDLVKAGALIAAAIDSLKAQS